jgi:hypothetical protein
MQKRRERNEESKSYGVDSHTRFLYYISMLKRGLRTDLLSNFLNVASIPGHKIPP